MTYRLTFAVGALVALLSPLALSGCDCGAGPGGCGGAGILPFEDSPTLDVPQDIQLGVPFQVTVRTSTVLPGVGTVALVPAVDRLRVLAPVRDTVDFGAGPASTAPVRVAFDRDGTLDVVWQVAVDRLPGSSVLNPQLSARVAMDSVRTDDGRLVPITDPGLCEAARGACAELTSVVTSGATPLSVRP